MFRSHFLPHSDRWVASREDILAGLAYHRGVASNIFPLTRRARREELERIDELLEAASLPALPSNVHLANVVVATRDEEVVGAIALEVVGRYGLLNSSVVAPEHRRTGVGKRLVQTVLARVSELGLREVYLLTEDASAFFERHGFRKVSRERVPGEIRTTRKFRDQGPDTADVMCLRLESRL